MRLHRITLLAIGSLWVLTATCCNSQIATSLFTTGPYDVSRFLRLHNDQTKESEKDGEDRGISTTTVESISNSLRGEANQLDTWLIGGKSTDDVFKLLLLDNIADTVLTSPKLQSYIDYMKLFNKHNPQQQTSLVSTLASNYGYDGLAQIIEAAKKVPGTAKQARRLETEMMQRWLYQEKTPDDIVKLLKLNEMRYDLFDKPELFTWVKYVDDFNEMYPKQKTTLFEQLSPLFDEGALVDMLIKAKSIPTTEKIAQRIQSEQTQYWLTNKKTPDDLFTLLRLNRAGDTLLENPLLDAWIKYAGDFREMHPKISLNTISTIGEYYPHAQLATMIVEATKSPQTEKIAYRLHSEQLRDWNMGGRTPAGVFNLLKLDEAGDQIFRNPLIPTWLKYVDFYNKRKTKPVSVTSMLRKRFGDEVFARMLVDAQDVASIRKIVSRMLDSLIKRWASNGVEPAIMRKWLLVDERK